MKQNEFKIEMTDIATAMTDGYDFEYMSDIQRFLLECDIKWLLKQDS